jgi:hypothetical protein
MLVVRFLLLFLLSFFVKFKFFLVPLEIRLWGSGSGLIHSYFFSVSDPDLNPHGSKLSGQLDPDPDLAQEGKSDPKN